jgi:hypothetical protein
MHESLNFFALRFPELSDRVGPNYSIEALS